MEEITNYINSFPKNEQLILKKLRTLVKKIAPSAVEGMAYGMLGFKLNKKPLVYFAGYKNHIGMYATPITHLKFASQIKTYKHGKGSVQFQLKESIPYALIEEMLKFKASLIEKEIKN